MISRATRISSNVIVHLADLVVFAGVNRPLRRWNCKRSAASVGRPTLEEPGAHGIRQDPDTGTVLNETRAGAGYPVLRPFGPALRGQQHGSVALWCEAVIA